MKIIRSNKEILIDDDLGYLLDKYTLSVNKRYAIAEDKKTHESMRLHRLIMGLSKGDKRVTDHINGIRLDNRKENLRICSRHQNNMHKTITANGVMRNIYVKKNGTFQVQVCLSRKSFHGGYFKDLDLAKSKAFEMRKELFGEFA